MLKTKYLASFLGLFILFVFSCSPKLDISLYHQADDSVDYSQYKNFEYWGWDSGSVAALTPMQRKRIEESFGKLFKERELTYVQEKGDLIVTLFIVTEQRSETQSRNTYYGGAGYGGYGGYGPYGAYGYGGYYGYGPGYGWGTGMSSGVVYEEVNYTAGTLLISIYDAKAKQLIYEAVAIKDSSQELKLDDRNLDLITRSMMYNFPIKPVQMR